MNSKPACANLHKFHLAEDKSDEEVADDGFGTRAEGVTMSGTLNFSTAELVAQTATLYCVTFEATPDSSSVNVTSGTPFTIDVWSGVNFGCFLVDSSTKDTIATLTVLDVGTGALGDGNKTSMQITTSVDLGSIDVANGVAAIPSTQLEKFATGTSALNPNDLHGKTYNVACNNTSAVPAEAKDKCSTSFENGTDNMDIYFRTLKATEDGQSIFGLGVWRAEEAFETTCGGFDFATAKFEEIEGNGITFDDSVTFGTYPNGCDLDDDGSAKANVAVGPLNKSGIGWTFKQDEEYSDGDCTVNKTMNIEFTGTAAKLAGLFNENVVVSPENCTLNKGSNTEAGTFMYPVIFTPK